MSTPSRDQAPAGRTRALVVGAGKIGTAIVGLLHSASDYDVTVLDRSERALSTAADLGVRTVPGDTCDVALLHRLATSHDMVLSAAPFHLTTTVARAARDAGAHYFDLTEDRASARAIAAMATDAPAPAVLMPQCGLAPGFVSVAAAALVGSFDELRAVSLRVGALPQFPTNALKYNLTWSTDGLINEYCNPCEAIVDGELREVAPLHGLEAFSLDGVAYEAFTTSGGLGTLGETLLGRVETLTYKTVRYPGHCEIVRLLVQDLRLAHRREVLKDVLETAIPVTDQDVVLIVVSVSGTRNGVLTQETFARKVYPTDVGGLRLSAIQLTTAAGICAMADLVREEKLPTSGFVQPQDCALTEFLANRFGSLYLLAEPLADVRRGPLNVEEVRSPGPARGRRDRRHAAVAGRRC
ncbi:MAG TPA: saccharopine dehydrogenase C-terminal domain-containing protein [Pseudonocardiaceae bacterium]|nr:saccharopine dehydrogenase C-terminal domain-containing protein [Pseudonocardiaceae bacterium]